MQTVWRSKNMSKKPKLQWSLWQSESGSHVEAPWTHKNQGKCCLCIYEPVFLFVLFFPLRFLVTWCYLWCLWMHDHIYHMDWLIKDILRLLFSFIVMCLTTCLFQLVRWSVQVFIERINEFGLMRSFCRMLTVQLYKRANGAQNLHGFSCLSIKRNKEF